MTRAHIADPHIIQKILERREDQIRPCVGMGYCIDSIYNGQAVCIHNAATGREGHLPQLVPKSTGPARKVVVVGAGPGGLEAARVAAERGHTVIVFEAAQHAGGQILTAAALKRRREILGIVDWRLSELARLGVEIRYNHYAEAEDVLAADPDYVVIATGGLPNTDFLRSGAEFATTSWDVLNGVAKVSGSVLVYDENGSHPGMTIAEFVANTTNQLEVITPERTLAIDIGATSYPPYFKTLNQVGAKITLNLRLESVERRGNKLVGIFDDEYAGVRVEKDADYIVVENGTLPMEDLYFSLKEHSINGGAVDYNALLEGETQAIERNPEKRFRLFRIGDAVASRNIHAAIYDAHRLMINA
ncbi:FAD-dependent oxidoreductase [Mesorhizobium kowhaii]|uniref:FAD-dependent oxidoreductase n=1 Tax=Mesorhizobium kowhaii TaxID=1300272 RepID=UPI0035F06423